MRMLFSLDLPRDEYSVPVVRHLTRDALNSLGVIEECVGDIEVAVTEACTNVFKHADAHDRYRVMIDIDESVCEIRVADEGAWFDSNQAGLVPAELDAEQGRGLHLIRAVVDDMRLESSPASGTVVHLIKMLKTYDDSVLRRLGRSVPAAE